MLSVEHLLGDDTLSCQERKSEKQMKRLKLLSLCAFVAFTVATVASASAWASEPSIWQCVKAPKEGKKYKGNYNDKKCSSPNAAGEGKYEFEEWSLAGKAGKVGKLKAKGVKGIGANLEVVGLGGVYCTGTSAEGEFTGSKAGGKLVATFTGCELEKKPCKSAGAKAGEIKTFSLKAELGYIDAAEHLVGAAFSAETGSYLAQFECGETIEMRVSGSAIGEVETGAKSPYNKFSKEVTIRFEQAAGHQECRGGKECVLLEGGPEEHELLTELANYGQENWGAPHESAEEDIIAGKGEELYLKA